MMRFRNSAELVLFSVTTTLVLSSAMFLVLYRTLRNKPFERFDVDQRFTNSLIYDNLIFMSGQVGTGLTIEEQTSSALQEVSSAIMKAGSNVSKILELTIWIKDMKNDYQKMNQVYDEWLQSNGCPPPCRACIEANLYSPDCLIEIRVIAAK